jgi:hypothetical protein
MVTGPSDFFSALDSALLSLDEVCADDASDEVLLEAQAANEPATSTPKTTAIAFLKLAIEFFSLIFYNLQHLLQFLV